MIELPFVFVSGLLGSAHCLGMCGPFAVAIGARAATWKANLARQAVYTLGRVFTYSFLGACAGFGGASVAGNSPTWVQIPAILAIAAGMFLIYQGLATAGAIRPWSWHWQRGKPQPTQPCLAASFFSTFLHAPTARGVFLAGLLTGFLPCGLVYAFLTLAASTSSLPIGALTMAVFGLGTAPIMMLAGWGGNLLGMNSRRRWLQIAAWCVVIAGLISIGRGLGYVSFGQEPAGCPFCNAE